MTEHVKRRKKLFSTKGIFDEVPQVISNIENSEMIMSKDEQKKMKKKKMKSSIEDLLFGDKIYEAYERQDESQNNIEHSKKKKKKRRNSSMESSERIDHVDSTNEFHSPIKKKLMDRLEGLIMETTLDKKNIAIVKQESITEENQRTKRESASDVEVSGKKKKKKKTSDIDDSISSDVNMDLGETELSSVKSVDLITSHKSSSNKKKKKEKKKTSDIDDSISSDVNMDQGESELSSVKSVDLITSHKSSSKKKKKDKKKTSDNDDSISSDVNMDLGETELSSVKSVDLITSHKSSSKKKKKEKKKKTSDIDDSISSDVNIDQGESELSSVKSVDLIASYYPSKKKKKKRRSSQELDSEECSPDKQFIKEVALHSEVLSISPDKVSDSPVAGGSSPVTKSRRQSSDVQGTTNDEISIVGSDVKAEPISSDDLSTLSEGDEPSSQNTDHPQISTNLVRKNNTASRFESSYVDGVTYWNGSLMKDPLLLNYHATQAQLKSAGVNCAFGAWSEKELKILRDNIDNYQKTRNIIDFPKYYMLHRKHELYISLGENINRPIKRIKNKLDLLFLNFDADVKEGAYTEEEIRELIRLYDIHGNNWRVISSALNRDPTSVRVKYGQLKGIVQKHKTDGVSVDKYKGEHRYFTEQEDEKIVEIVNRLAQNENGEIVESKINWVLVAQHVGTRSSTSVRQRWHLNLNTKYENSVMEEGFRQETFFYGKVKHAKLNQLCIRILRIVLESGVTDKVDVNWTNIAARIKGNFDPIVLRSKFYRHVNKCVPNHSQKTFQEMLEYFIRVNDVQTSRY